MEQKRALPMSPEEKRFMNRAKRLKMDDSCTTTQNKRGLGYDPPVTKSKVPQNAPKSVEFPSSSGSVKPVRKYLHSERRVFFSFGGTYRSSKDEPMEFEDS